MPIRMVDDPNDSFDNSNQGRSGGGGGRFREVAEEAR